MWTKVEWETRCFPKFVTPKPTFLLSKERPKRLILYGAGYAGLMFAELLTAHGLAPECILDNSPKKYGRTICGIPVKAVEDCQLMDSVVVVCMLRMGETYQKIRTRLLQMGCPKVIHLLELSEDHVLFQGQNLILSPHRELLWENRESLYQVYQLLEDEPSRETLDAILLFLWGETESHIPALPIEQQYFAYDLFQKDSHEVFVDCGAHVGETLQQFLERNGDHFQTYCAIEPDIKNVQQMKTQCPSALSHKIHIWNLAVGKERCDVQIRNYDGSNSVICQNGELSSKCVPLDSYAEYLHPTHLKIDVEGWDYDTLLGAKQIIQRDKPVISVAVYHREQDFWEIPLLLKEWVPEYHFYLRSYLNVFETVLYAIPPTRLVKGE